MVKNYGDDQINGLSSASVTTSLLSIGILFSIVSTLFFGIKLKWFRYRMNFPNEQENPVMLRAHSVTEIRENCSVGCYRQSLQEDTLIRIDNESRSTTPPSSSSDNVKSKKTDRESIFRWPFKNKLALSKSSSMKEDNKTAETIRSTMSAQPFRQSSSYEHEYSERDAHDQAIAEKNARIKRSIYERLNSKNGFAASMPDLVQCDEQSFKERDNDYFVQPPPRKELTLQKGIEVSLDDATDEIQEINIETVPTAKVISNAAQISEIEENVITEVDEEEEMNEIPVRPPTPIRRRSRSNSLKPPQADDDKNNQEIVLIPPPVKPRKKHANARNTLEFPTEVQQNEDLNAEINLERRPSHSQDSNATPKSILKSNDETSNHSKPNVHFINVPDSSESDDDEYGRSYTNQVNINFDDDDDDDDDIWKKIDLHRTQLSKKYVVYGSDEENGPPPLPKTPPPSAIDQERDFTFA